MKISGKLLFCILMDTLGLATYLLPIFGELGDVVWAPFSAYIFYKTFGGGLGKIGGVLNFLEEILPYTDLLPTFTLAWLWENRKRNKLETK